MPKLSALALGAALLTACGPTAHDLRNAQIHYDLGVNAMELQHDPQTALREFQAALQANPNMPEVQNGLGLVDHLMLHKPEEAVPHYLKALELDPKYSEAANNLGAAYLDLGRYADAARLFQQALSDELYRTPYIAEGNLGWALYKEGDVQGGLKQLRAAVERNPGYCQGYRSIGIIDADQGKLDEAEREFRRFHEKCPDIPESNYRLGLVLLKEGHGDEARDALRACAGSQNAKDTDLGLECGRLLKLLQ